MNGRKVPIVRINPYDDIDSWVNSFSESIGRCVFLPEKETWIEGSQFCNWRLTYGVSNGYDAIDGGAPVYFLAFYPPFCANQKAIYHYPHLSQLAKDVLILENFLVGVNRAINLEVDAQDIIAVAFSILRKKESVELFQEQKDLMEFGLQHYHLDNYYQDLIRALCTEYQKTGCVMDKPLHISLFDTVGVTFKPEDSDAKEK